MAKVDRRIIKSQEAIKKAIIELISEKNFDQITIQDISDRANVSRKTIYLHYADKFDLLDKLIEEYIDRLRKVSETACEMEWRPATQVCFEYLESNYLFFSTMLANKGAPYFRSRFLEYQSEAFRNELRKTNERNSAVNEEVIVHFVASAYVGVVEWWLTNGMPYPPRVMADQVGTLFEAIYN
ncbi:TetR/AcrR family transcriptional regulator [Cohnella thailandensis]|uniref:TetR/AcrR family transcriptional regulator n=1 Tax=Cohnella thailandensis TaxID=557557 RepID=A0A841SXI0_9BACL|nr:TetR/AcrR family transcriptional regulator [Cohnella thailandensis]MBB6636614.1 TetR/AcrR family transcriptional regulator [Cohnella thailandensis]MBP1973512.1 AcrR family transcriptional regulator [Cohnella thailandensis]